MLTRLPGRQTGDLDIVSEGLNHDVRHAGRMVAAERNLAPEWINDGAKGFAVSVDVDPERIFTGKRLVVDSAGPKYLLAMKLLSGRKADEVDCVQLIRETGLYNEEELLDLIQQAAGRRGVRPRDEYWAREMLARARKGRLQRKLGSWLSSAGNALAHRRSPKAQDPKTTSGICGAQNKSKSGLCTHPRPTPGGRCAAGHRH